MSKDVGADPDDEPITPGETVYDEDGQVLGQVSGYTTDGFEVKIGEGGSASGDDAETIPGQEFGEGYLMWRCSECGEMGDLGSGMPDTCPGVVRQRSRSTRSKRTDRSTTPWQRPRRRGVQIPGQGRATTGALLVPCLADIGWKYPANPREVSGTTPEAVHWNS